MVYVTGDTHADFSRFSVKSFPEQNEMTWDDVVIVLGDFGGVWSLYSGDEREEKWLNWLAAKPFTLCFCDGNHENFDRLCGDEFEIVEFHGGKAHKIRENIYHLMRGYIFNFDGKSFFCMGGASSHDIRDGILDPWDYESGKEFENVYTKWYNAGKMFRVNHISWWKEELPSQDEMDFGAETLRSVDYQVDYVISYCLPQSAVAMLGFHGADSLTTYFDKLLDDGLRFKKWYCGHYHFDREMIDRYRILYYGFERVV